MRPSLFLMAALMATAVVPANAEPDEACDNRAFFTNQLMTIPAGQTGGPGVANLNDLSVEERAMLEDAVDELARQTEGLCMARALANAEDIDGFAVASSHFLIYESMHGPLGSDDLRCSGQLKYPRERHHYNDAHPVPAGGVPSSRGNPEYAGWATSPMPMESQHSVPYSILVTAFIHDYVTGKTFTYEPPILYGGVSDFYCFSFRHGYFGVPYSFNIPAVTGFATDLAAPT